MIFVDFVSRSFDFEPLQDRTTEQCIMGFPRMNSIHSIPQVILCDSVPEHEATERTNKDLSKLTLQFLVLELLAGYDLSPWFFY